ncbi:hypothetical protein PybrP1_002480 [[Pythium] brassicae (nom. inval.)]|nr:hypothetical protein PybrP1_002480 [[Pythium] brassicae (nom. inval.)]
MSTVVRIEDLVTDAAAAGDTATLEELIANGARVNDTDNDGYCALAMATKHGHLHCVELLLGNGADVNLRDRAPRGGVPWSRRHRAAAATSRCQQALRHLGGDDSAAARSASRPRGHCEHARRWPHSDEDTRVRGGDGMHHHRYMLHIAYLGTNFVGWQRQLEASANGKGSVQELVENVVTDVLRADRRVNVTSVSRTDAGTHALYQYGSIRLDAALPVTLSEFKALVNAQLPESVVLHAVTEMAATARLSRIRSRYKKYVYYIQQGERPDLDQGRFSWFIGKTMDPQRMRDALALLVGEHDFRPLSQGLHKAAFAAKSMVRTLVSARVRVRTRVCFSLDPAVCGTGEVVGDEAAFLALAKAPTRDGGAVAAEANEQKKRKVVFRPGSVPVYFICVELVANGFLRHMVRRIVGTLRPIGEGTYPPSRMKHVLDGAVEPGPSAPAKGLWLQRTWLSQADWDADDTREA